MINKIPLSLGLMHTGEVKVSRELLGDVHLRKITKDHCTLYPYVDIEKNKMALNLLNNICHPFLYVETMGWNRGSTQLYPCSYFCKL